MCQAITDRFACRHCATSMGALPNRRVERCADAQLHGLPTGLCPSGLVRRERRLGGSCCVDCAARFRPGADPAARATSVAAVMAMMSSSSTSTTPSPPRRADGAAAAAPAAPGPALAPGDRRASRRRTAGSASVLSEGTDTTGWTYDDGVYGYERDGEDEQRGGRDEAMMSGWLGSEENITQSGNWTRRLSRRMSKGRSRVRSWLS